MGEIIAWSQREGPATKYRQPCYARLFLFFIMSKFASDLLNYNIFLQKGLLHDPSGRVLQQSIDNLAMQGYFCFLLWANSQAICSTKNKKPFSEEKGCLYFVAVREGLLHDPAGWACSEAWQPLLRSVLVLTRQARKRPYRTKNKNPFLSKRGCLCFTAVREGFEPSVQLPVRQFSKLFLSASQAPHPF